MSLVQVEPVRGPCPFDQKSTSPDHFGGFGTHLRGILRPMEAEGRLNGGLGAKPPGIWGPYGPTWGPWLLSPLGTPAALVLSLVLFYPFPSTRPCLRPFSCWMGAQSGSQMISCAGCSEGPHGDPNSGRDNLSSRVAQTRERGSPNGSQGPPNWFWIAMWT
mgnify:CR=1 FL=1